MSQTSSELCHAMLLFTVTNIPEIVVFYIYTHWVLLRDSLNMAIQKEISIVCIMALSTFFLPTVAS